jgi:hypothetical protein
MPISRAQIPEQIKGYKSGDIVESNIFEDDFRTGTDLGGLDMEQFKVDEDELRALQEAFRAGQRRPILPDLGGAPSAERVKEYTDILTGIAGGPPRQPNIFDVASQVGASMLAADPREGAFRSLGRGIAEAGARRRKQQAEFESQRRSIAAKAFELAKNDEDAAIRYLRDADIAVSKTNPDNKTSDYVVVDSAGLTVDEQYYGPGETVMLTDQEAMGARSKIRREGKKGTGLKATAVGEPAYYMLEADARKLIASLGLESGEEFERIVAKITVPEGDPKLGKPVPVQGLFGELTPMSKDGSVIKVVLGPSRLASKEINARFNTYKDERLKDMAKEAKESIDQGVKILPTVSQAMSILRTNENIRTGNVAANELRFFKRNLEILLTGKPSEVTEALDTLNAISNQLAPLMRMKGSGSTSDMEFQAYRDAILSLGNTAIANYVSLYALRKKIENSIQLFELERRMLLSDDVESIDQITQAMKEVDQGIIEKYTGPDDAESYNNFLAALPEGAVIDNFDRLFEKYNPELPEMGAFVIKGWKGGRR